MDYSNLRKMQIFNLITDEEIDFADLSEEQRDDEDILLEAIKYEDASNVLKYASERLKDDEDIVLKAVKQDGYALYWASERLKDNKEIVLEAVKQSGNALYYASERLQNDKDLLELLESVSIFYISTYYKKWYEERMEFLANLRKAEAMDKDDKISKKIKF